VFQCLRPVFEETLMKPDRLRAYGLLGTTVRTEDVMSSSINHVLLLTDVFA
jgi:hypothetical protein